MRELFQMQRSPELTRRLVFLVFSGLAAVGLGFVVVSPSAGKDLIEAGGYYFILGLSSLFVFYARRVTGSRWGDWRQQLRRPNAVVFALVAASAFTIWSDPFRHKILFDEYVLQATALHMHATKEVGTVIRAYDIGGWWVPIDAFLDKRPYFFAFLVSLAHDLTGYRMANIFVVNALLAPCFLALVYWLGRNVAGRGASLLAVGLLATLPLLGQQVSGAGFELHNLAMLALVMALGIIYLRAPGEDRLSLLVIGALLLAQSRYESVIFVCSAAAVIVAGWYRAGRIIISWPAVFAPLLLVPYAWHNRYLSASPILHQLAEGQTSRFGFDYLLGNLEGAWGFFFNSAPSIANSWYLSALGLVGLGGALFETWRWARAAPRREADPAAVVLWLFGLGIAANLALLMFYYWSKLNDVMASRFALPMCLLLALVAARVVHALSHRWRPAVTFAAVGLAAWTFGWGIPAMARREYTNMNLVMQEVEWEHEKLRERGGRVLFVTNKSTIPFVLWRVPTIINGVGRQRGAQIQYHLREGTFDEVIIAQALRPTTLNGDMGVDPEDLMPPNYRLETVAEKRFGGRWARLSRLVAIEPATDAPADPPSPDRVADGELAAGDKNVPAL